MTFDPDAGYDLTLKNYFGELALIKKHINTKKAKKYFDKQWKAEAWDREIEWLKNQLEARRAKLLNEWKNPSKPSQVTLSEPVSNVLDSNTSKTKTSSLTSKKEQPTSPLPTYDSRERALEAMANAQIAIENALRIASNLDWGRNYRLNNGIFDPIPDFLSEKEYHIPTPELSLKGRKSVSNTKLTFLMLKNNNLKSSLFDPIGTLKSLDFSSIQRINPLLRKLGYDIPKDESVEYYNKLYKDMLGEDEYNKLLLYMRLGLVDSKKHGGNLIPFYLKGKSIISNHPSSKNTSEYAADSTYYDNIIKKFGDPLKRFDVQYLLDNNEFGYDQNEEWRTSNDGSKWRSGDYYNSKYGISSYIDTVNSKGEKYREINIDEPGGGLDEKDSFSPVYRFRYKYDLKLGKYIPTNEWFMDKVIYRKQGGKLKLPFMLKGKPIVRFGVSGKNPKDANRTPQWDSEEEAIFNPAEDDKFLKSNNITYTKDGMYYLDKNGQYLPGIIYHSPNGKDWNHYSLTSDGIKTFDKRNLSLDLYNLYKSLGIDPVRFYRNAEEAEFYRPNPNLKLPEKETRIGNSTITFKEGFPYEKSYMGQKPNAISKASLREYTDYGSWHVVDPDKGYDFTLRSDRLRDGGSRTVDLLGKYPEEWDEYTGIVRYNGMDEDDGSAQRNREALNKLISAYGILLDKQGGNLNKLSFMLKGDKITPLYNYLKDKMLEERDLIYNDYALQSPNKEKELNISKSYFKTPIIPNVIKGTYHYLKSDPLNFYGFIQGLKLDYRKAVRKDKKEFPNLSRVIYGD